MSHQDLAHGFASCRWSYSEDPHMRFIRRQCCRVLLIDNSISHLKCHRTKNAVAFGRDIDDCNGVTTSNVRNTSSKREPIFIFEWFRGPPRGSSDLSRVDVLLRADSSYLDHNTML